MSPAELNVGDILAVLFSRCDGQTFHWAICIPFSSTTAIKLHAKDPGGGNWFFEDPPPHEKLLSSPIVCAAIKLGNIGPRSLDEVTGLLKDIPLAIPDSDKNTEPRFSCRVWLREAVRHFDAAGLINCSDINALEAECRSYALENDASQPSYKGYSFFISGVSS